MSNHILLVADGRSPTALSWIANLQALGYDVSLVSTFPCKLPAGLRMFYILPIALSRLSSGSTSGGQHPPSSHMPSLIQKMVRRFAPTLQSLRYIIGPLTLFRFALTYRRLVKRINPDLVHALRIPFEGMLGSYTPAGFPFLASTWGNDLTLHADGSCLMRAFTKRCLQRVDGLTADTQRDIRLAREWGLPMTVPSLVVPGSGGLDLDAITAAEGFDPSVYGIPTASDWVVNPRGLRPGSVHQDVFFAAIPAVLAERSNTCFICPSLAGNAQAQAWVEQFNLQQSTHLLPKLPQPLLWSLLKRSQVFVSPSSHDGTPNSLLEAMACGSFPVVGDIESMREWITPGVNGLLVDPLNPQQLATAICQALDDPNLRQTAADHNLALVNQRAAQSATQPKIDAFYRLFIS
ncbi:MAG: glycosyltransferase family 4 protein [Brevefilum sp.]|nr:glycosyltransferase family 4 protein [Brevefilum sp.]